MLPTEDLFVYVYALIDDLITARIIAIPPRPGPRACLQRRRTAGHRAGPPPAGPPQRGGLPG